MVTLYQVVALQSDKVNGDEFNMFSYEKNSLIEWMEKYRPDLCRKDYFIREIEFLKEDIALIDNKACIIKYTVKKCPFCGGRAEIKVFRDGDANGDDHWEAKVECTKCSGQTMRYPIDGYYGTTTTIKDVVDKWNNRISE